MDSSQIRDSKYCMLEILRSAYLRSEAVTPMRGLNKRFLKLSTDDYLDNFNDTMDTMYIEVRCADHLDYLQRAIKYVNLMKGNECLKVDFYYASASIVARPLNCFACNCIVLSKRHR